MKSEKTKFKNFRLKLNHIEGLNRLKLNHIEFSSRISKS